MTTLFRYTFACLAALLVVGCGGGSSSSSSSVSRTINSAPSSAEFYDTDGALVSRMQFLYPDELTINVQLQNAGADMLWDTDDDASHQYLQCLYMSAPTPLLRYPDPYFLGIARTPTGALVLSVLAIPANGMVIKCPVRNGRRLQQESGYMGNPFISSPGDSYSYLVNAELESFGGTATEVLNYEFVGVDPAALEEPELPIIGDHTQITTVLYDAERRPLSIDLVAESPWTTVLDEYCVNGDTIAIHMMFLRDCSSVRETRSYRYIGDSVEQDRQRYNGSNPADVYTSTATRLANRVIVYSGTADAGPTSVAGYQLYPFNESGQVTAMGSRSYGDDEIWGTEDDLHISLDTYHYDDKGKLYEARRATQRNVYDYYPDGKLEQVDVFDDQSIVPVQRTLVSYLDGSPAKITVQRRFEYPDGGYVLKKRIVIDFAISEESWLPMFAPFSPFPGMPPNIDDLMQFQPIR